MNKQKLNIIMSLFIFSIIGISIFLFLNKNEDVKKNNKSDISYNENKTQENIKKVEKENFDPNKFDSIESYLKTIKVDGIDFEKENFYVKIKENNLDKLYTISQDKFSFYNSDKNTLKEVIEVINQGYLNKTIFPEGGNGKSGIKMIDPTSISQNAKFFENIMYEKNITKNWQKYKKDLENKKSKSDEDIKKLSFIYDVEGNYSKKNELCSLNKCVKDISINISGTVKDQEGNVLDKAKVYLLNDSGINTFTDKDGKYNISLKTNELSTLRLRVIKDGYSDSISNIYVVFESKDFTFNRDFVLAKPLKIIEVTKNDMLDGKFEIAGNISNYEINTDGLVDKNGNKVNPEKLSISLFEFNRSNLQGLENYFNIDIFDNSGNYNGNTFVTYGMPYLILKDEKGEEVFISKQNPAKIIDNIANIDDLLKENQDIDGNKTVTKTDIEKMVQKNDFIYLSKYAKENNIIMPYKWNLNVKRGIREESPVKFIDSETAKAETIYYNVD